MIKDDKGIAPLIWIILLIFGAFFMVFFIQQIIYLIVVIAIVVIVILFMRGYLKTQTKYTPLVVIFTIIVLLVLAFAGPLLFSMMPSIDDKTKVIGPTWGYVGRGTFQDVDGDGVKELLDSVRYITMWKPGGRSEKMIAVGKVYQKDIAADIDLYYFNQPPVSDGRVKCEIVTGIGKGNIFKYEWYIWSGSWQLKWTDIYCTGSDIDQNEEVTAEPSIHEFDEPYTGGVKVIFYMLQDSPNPFDGDRCTGGTSGYGGFCQYARDEALVFSGVGKVEFEKDQYEINSTARINYETGYANSAKTDSGTTYSESGWTLVLYNSYQAAPVGEWTLGDNQKSYVEYKVTMKDWQCGGQNQLWGYLRNSLVNQDKDFTTTIDFLGKGPCKPTITTDKSSYEVGDKVTITLHSEPNAETKLPVKGYFLYVHMEDPEYDIAMEWLNGTNTYTTEPLPDDGMLRIEAHAFDECRASEVNDDYVVKVYPTGEAPIIDLGGDLDWNLIILILIIVFSIIIAYVLLRKKKGRK